MSNTEDLPDRFVAILDRLCTKSIEDYYNPFLHFSWPDAIPEKSYWMTPSLMSTYGTSVENEIPADQLMALSKWESINFYSMNVHGIRELIIEVVNRIHTPGFELPSEFFHHFIGEENEHMWFFSQFCHRYGGKLYPTMSMKATAPDDPAIAHFLVFSRILLFEEIVDHYNTTMAGDEILHDTIREVNRIHHKDESRHIAFGRELVALLFDRLQGRLSDEKHSEIEAYLKRYITVSLQAFCNPKAYKDAGIHEPYRVRERVLADPQRALADTRAIRKPMTFFTKAGVFRDPVLRAA